jgi:hypothetical protein
MSRSDYKNIYEGYLDNTGYNNRRVAERYGGCGSEPTTILSEPSVASLYEGYEDTAGFDKSIKDKLQTIVNDTYKNIKAYVEGFRNNATEYYIYGLREKFAGLKTSDRNSGVYARFVNYRDITKTNWGGDNTRPSECKLLDTVRTDYFKKGYKSEICCKANLTYWNNCYFNDNINDVRLVQSNLGLNAFTFNVDEFKKYIKEVQFPYLRDGTTTSLQNFYLDKSKSNDTKARGETIFKSLNFPSKWDGDSVANLASLTGFLEFEKPPPPPKLKNDVNCTNSASCESGCCGKYKGLFNACWASNDTCINKSRSHCGCK